MSYIGWGLLWLRLNLILASGAFMAWGIWTLNVSMDTTLYNFILIIINIVLTIPLLWAYVPTILSKDQKFIYNKYFCSFFTKSQFKRLLKYSDLEKWTVKSPIET